MSIDFKRWALVAPNDDTGLGRMAQDLKAVLPIGRHFVTASDRMDPRALKEGFEVLLNPAWSVAELKEKLQGLQGIIFFERCTWHPELLFTTRGMGIRSVAVPMWEWFRGKSPLWENCDFFACPNEVCLKVVRSYGYQNAACVPWLLDLRRFPGRRIRGSARHFVHNAGFIDPDDRKGTRDAIAAFSNVPGPDLRLTVRVQKQAAVSTTDDRVHLNVGSLADPTALYAEGDAFIQPSKLEGLGFMVLEAVASGLPVITLDQPPMNEWVRQPELLAKPRWLAYPAYSSAWIEHSHLRLPQQRDLSRRILWATENDLEPISVANREWAERVFAPRNLLEKWQQLLSAVYESPPLPPVPPKPEPRSPSLSIPNKVRRRVASFTGWTLPYFAKPM